VDLDGTQVQLGQWMWVHNDRSKKEDHEIHFLHVPSGVGGLLNLEVSRELSKETCRFFYNICQLEFLSLLFWATSGFWIHNTVLPERHCSAKPL
jgi:hypothetical protein